MNNTLYVVQCGRIKEERIKEVTLYGYKICEPHQAPKWQAGYYPIDQVPQCEEGVQWGKTYVTTDLTLAIKWASKQINKHINSLSSQLIMTKELRGKLNEYRITK